MVQAVQQGGTPNITPKSAPAQSEVFDYSGIVQKLASGIGEIFDAERKGAKVKKEAADAAFLGKGLQEGFQLAIDEQYSQLEQGLGPEELAYLKKADGKIDRLKYLKEQGRGDQVYRIKENELMLKLLKEKPELSQEILARFGQRKQFTDVAVAAQEKEAAERAAELSELGKAKRKQLIDLGIADPQEALAMTNEEAIVAVNNSVYGQTLASTARLKIETDGTAEGNRAAEERRKATRNEARASVQTVVLGARVGLLEELRNQPDPAVRQGIIAERKLSVAKEIAALQSISVDEAMATFDEELGLYDALNDYDPLASDASAEGNRALLIENQIRTEATLRAQGFLATSGEAREYKALQVIFGGNNLLLQNQSYQLINGALAAARDLDKAGGGSGSGVRSDKTFIPTGGPASAAATDSKRMIKAKTLAPQITASLAAFNNLPDGPDKTDLALTTLDMITNEVNQNARAAYLSETAGWFGSDEGLQLLNSLATTGEPERIGKYRKQLGEYAYSFANRVGKDIADFVDLDAEGLPYFVAPKTSGPGRSANSNQMAAFRAKGKIAELRKLIKASNHFNLAAGSQEGYLETALGLMQLGGE